MVLGLTPVAIDARVVPNGTRGLGHGSNETVRCRITLIDTGSEGVRPLNGKLELRRVAAECDQCVTELFCLWRRSPFPGTRKMRSLAGSLPPFLGSALLLILLGCSCCSSLASFEGYVPPPKKDCYRTEIYGRSGKLGKNEAVACSSFGAKQFGEN